MVQICLLGGEQRGKRVDFSKAWKGVASLKARFPPNDSVATLEEIALALDSVFEARWEGSGLLFVGGDWLWVSHNFDPFMYVSRGRVEAAATSYDGEHTYRFDLQVGPWLGTCVLAAAVHLLLTPTAYAVPAIGFVLLSGTIWAALVPLLFVMKVQRLVEAAVAGQ